MFLTQRLLLPAYQTCDSCQKLICFSCGEVGHTVWGVAPAQFWKTDYTEPLATHLCPSWEEQWCLTIDSVSSYSAAVPI